MKPKAKSKPAFPKSSDRLAQGFADSGKYPNFGKKGAVPKAGLGSKILEKVGIKKKGKNVLTGQPDKPAGTPTPLPEEEFQKKYQNKK